MCKGVLCVNRCPVDSKSDLKWVKNAGSVFVGDYSPQSMGDYISGPNHVLPTGRVGRVRGGLSVMDFVKVITVKGSDKILGATIVGEHAGDSLVEFVAAMKHGFGLEGILGTIHTYPTMGEANKYAAGVYKRSTATKGKVAVGKALNDWTRGEGSFFTVLGKGISLLVSPDNTPAYPKETSHH